MRDRVQQVVTGPQRLLVGAVLALLVVLSAACEVRGERVNGTGPPAQDLREEVSVTLARANWETGFFQAAIVARLLEDLGYEVTDPAAQTRTPESFYPLLARGELDLWVNGWFPLHDAFLERELVTGQRVDEPIEPVGNLVAGGAVQGYLADKATAEALDITSMEDFARPEVAEAFDQDGDGRADLYGCEEGWGCRLAIDEHLAQFAWGESVEQTVGDYEALVAEAGRRIDAGEPVLLYTWTPNWTVELLEPGTDVVWLEAPALPGETAPTSVADLPGCAGDDPCALGWAVNDIRAVGHRVFLDDNPPVRRLLDVVQIPGSDVAAQNAQMLGTDEYTDAQIDEDAAAWIADNRDVVDQWLEHARDG